MSNHEALPCTVWCLVRTWFSRVEDEELGILKGLLAPQPACVFR
ncbi:hypothetical protein ACFLZP_04620 [Patescibacteria group bacterium]